MTDAEIANTAPEELAGLPDDFWRKARLVDPVLKRAISIRVDEDVLVWFRNLGPRYPSRMNAILRSDMTQMCHQRSRQSRDKACLVST
jgi:uncharacterized protein (DUF4415 family)